MHKCIYILVIIKTTAFNHDHKSFDVEADVIHVIGFNSTSSIHKMIAGMKLVAALFILIAVVSEAFRMSAAPRDVFSLRMALSDYKEELAKTASAIASPGNA
jgi:hypothetical protein